MTTTNTTKFVPGDTGTMTQEVYGPHAGTVVRSFTVLEPANEAGVLRVRYDADDLSPAGSNGYVRETEATRS